MKKTYVVYNTILDKIVYVGSSKNPEKRFYAHKWRANNIENGKSYSKYAMKPLHHHMNEFGVDNFSFEVVSDENIEVELQETLKPICCIKYG